MKILITGASGFIGSAFMHRFGARDDLELFGIGRRANPKLPPAVTYLAKDLSQPFHLEFKPDAVIHAAALASPWGAKNEYYKQNIEVTRNVIEYCKRAGLPRLVYVSSSSVFYRNEHQYALHENSPIGPTFVNTYAATKYAGERLVGGYGGQKTILRPRAVFGPGDTVLFPRILAAALKGRLPRFINDGPPAVGDVIFIDTLCDYILKAVTSPNVQDSYNLTNAEPVQIEAFLAKILASLNLPTPDRQISVGTAMRIAACIEWLFRTFRLPGEPPITKFGIGVFAYSKTFNPHRTIKDFGPPSVSLDEGVEKFIQWQKQQWQ